MVQIFGHFLLFVFHRYLVQRLKLLLVKNRLLDKRKLIRVLHAVYLLFSLLDSLSSA